MPRIGESLGGRYRLDALIGSGGFAAVFRAHDLRLERDVAVKVLLANHATDPAIAARFDREARVLATVSHPNVVAIHDVAPGRSGDRRRAVHRHGPVRGRFARGSPRRVGDWRAPPG